MFSFSGYSRVPYSAYDRDRMFELFELADEQLKEVEDAVNTAKLNNEYVLDEDKRTYMSFNEFLQRRQSE